MSSHKRRVFTRGKWCRLRSIRRSAQQILRQRSDSEIRRALRRAASNEEIDTTIAYSICANRQQAPIFASALSRFLRRRGGDQYAGADELERDELLKQLGFPGWIIRRLVVSGRIPGYCPQDREDQAHLPSLIRGLRRASKPLHRRSA